MLALLMIMLSVTITKSQINGNGEITSQSYNLSDFNSINIELYADVTIDKKLESQMTITADENILEYIGKSIKSKILSIEQLKWIEPSKKVKITIGAPMVNSVILTSWGTVSIVNIDNKELSIDANVGEVILEGKTDYLYVNTGQARINATNLIAKNAKLKSSGYANVSLNVINKLDTKIESKQTQIILVNTPQKITGNFNPKLNKVITEDAKGVEYIDFKIKNNSWNRRHFYVVGPKKDGTTFSYGFPMNPGATREERWTTGTKIYREYAVGNRKLLVTIGSEDEDKVVDLFD